MVYLRNILVTTDLSDYSLAAIEHAASLGLLYSSKIYFLHVIDAPAASLLLHGIDVATPTTQRHSEEEAMRELESFVTAKVNPDIRLTPIVRCGTPAEEIKRFAEEAAIDLVVMATHGRTGVKHIVLGSVAEKVVRISTVPVLTVKPQPIRENILKNEDIESELHYR
jgi:nucleotide-binding universal stress UspA family protein